MNLRKYKKNTIFIDDNDDEWDYEGEEFSGQDPTTIPTPCEAPAGMVVVITR